MQMAEQAGVAHALQVRQAVYTDDYAAFFRFYAGKSHTASQDMHFFLCLQLPWTLAGVSVARCFMAACSHALHAAHQHIGAPNMGRALMDMFVAVVRWRALSALVRAFKPSIAVAFVARLLGFVKRSGKVDGNGGDGGSDADAAAGDAAALEVLPGCSAAVFPGKSQPQVWHSFLNLVS